MAGVAGRNVSPDNRNITFARFYAEHERLVRRIARRRLGEPDLVDEAVQDTFLRLARRLPEFDDLTADSVRKLVSLVATRATIDVLRRNRVRWSHDVPMGHAELASAEATRTPALAPIARDPLETVVQNEDSAVVVRALLDLAPAQRDVIVAHHLNGIAYEAIADDAGVSPSTMRQRAKRARVAFVIAYSRLTAGGQVVGLAAGRRWLRRVKERVQITVNRLVQPAEQWMPAVAATLERQVVLIVALAHIFLGAAPRDDVHSIPTPQDHHGARVSFPPAGVVAEMERPSSTTPTNVGDGSRRYASIETADVLPDAVRGTGELSRPDPTSGDLQLRVDVPVAGKHVDHVFEAEGFRCDQTQTGRAACSVADAVNELADR